jgi:hypothetical protein
MKILKDLAVSGSITVGQFLQSSINTDKFLVSESGVVKYRSGSQLLGDIGAAASGHTHTFASLTSKPTTLSGYGITDAVNTATTITINGTTYDLSANRSWTVTTSETDTLASVTGRGASTSTAIIFSNSLAVGHSSHYDSTQFSLDINGGLLVKNTGKTAQFVLINANPAAGGNAGFVMHTVGGTTSGAFATIQTYYGASIAAGTLQLQPSGGSVTIGGSTVFHAGNYTSYSPTLTGSGASGTWGINITGSASALGGYTQDFQTVIGTGDYLIIRNQAASKLSLASWASVQSGLGLGSMAYAATGSYLPIGSTAAAAVYADRIQTSNNQWIWSNGAHTATNPNTITLWDQYSSNGGVGYLTAYATIMDIYGRSSHEHDQLYFDSSGTIYHRNCFYGTNSWNGWRTMWDSSTLTNLNQLSNGPGYITGYTEVDTLATVTARGGSTTAGITVNGRMTALGGGTYAVTGSSTQRYIMQALNTSNSVNAAYGWWWFHNTNGDMGFHADGIGDILTLTRGGGFTINGNTVLTAGNYTSYSPSLTGSGASGTWGISITGNAATLGGYGPNQTGGAYNIVQRDANGYIQNSYFYMSGGGSERNSSGLGYIAGFNSSDYYVRSYNSTAVASFLGLGSMAYASTGSYLALSGGVMTGSLVNNTDGAVIIESNASENNNWLWKENAKAWGLFWFNRGSQSGQTIGSYTTIGAELMFMGESTGIAMPSGWTGYYSTSKIAAMISNYNGYIYSASTIYAATSMVVGGNTVVHAGNVSSYALSYGSLSGSFGMNDNKLYLR